MPLCHIPTYIPTPCKIVLGKSGITADTALRLSRLLKTSPELWMRLRADWGLHQVLQREARRAS
jgi:addiction module HigA family antidote